MSESVKMRMMKGPRDVEESFPPCIGTHGNGKHANSSSQHMQVCVRAGKFPCRIVVQILRHDDHALQSRGSCACHIVTAVTLKLTPRNNETLTVCAIASTDTSWDTRPVTHLQYFATIICHYYFMSFTDALQS